MIDERYTLGDLVGSGGMAEVYRGTDRVLEREVAVKMMRDTTTDPTARARFDAEARTLASLNHPGLVSILDAGLHHEHPYLVMELIDGPTLTEQLRATGPLNEVQVLELGAQLAEALAYAHSRGVIHRDVKPSNILLCPEGRAVLTDFGIARLVSDTSEHTLTGQVIGSPAYLSPEQVNGGSATTAVDVYALGLVLLEAATNVRTYPGTPIEAAIARLTAPPLIPDFLHPGLAALVARMTALDPQERPSAEEAATTLRRIQTGPTGEADPTATAVLELPPPQRRPRPVAALLLAAAVVLALAVAGLAQLGSGEDDAAPSLDTTASTPSPTATPTQRPVSAPVTKPSAAPKPQAKAPVKAPAPKKKAGGKGKGKGKKG